MMRNNISVHQLNEKDLQSLVQLWNQESNLLTSSKFIMTYKKALDGFSKKMFDYFGIYNNTNLIGFILVSDTNTDIWLKHMVIDKRFRSQGLGTYFLNEVLKQYNKSEKSFKAEVLINNFQAKEFFERNGFKVEKNNTNENQYIFVKDNNEISIY